MNEILLMLMRADQKYCFGDSDQNLILLRLRSSASGNGRQKTERNRTERTDKIVSFREPWWLDLELLAGPARRNGFQKNGAVQIGNRFGFANESA